MKIGNVKVEGKLVLAPMAGVNCASFRLLCREHGAALVYTPMVHIRGIVEAPETIINTITGETKAQPVDILDHDG